MAASRRRTGRGRAGGNGTGREQSPTVLRRYAVASGPALSLPVSGKVVLLDRIELSTSPLPRAYAFSKAPFVIRRLLFRPVRVQRYSNKTRIRNGQQVGPPRLVRRDDVLITSGRLAVLPCAGSDQAARVESAVSAHPRCPSMPRGVEGEPRTPSGFRCSGELLVKPLSLGEAENATASIEAARMTGQRRHHERRQMHGAWLLVLRRRYVDEPLVQAQIAYLQPQGLAKPQPGIGQQYQ